MKPGDWVCNASSQLARVKDVWFDGEYLIDIVFYERDGTKIGRRSPALGGPRSFDPACPFVGWSRIETPSFPLRLGRIERDGRTFIDWVVQCLPDRQWKRPARRVFAKRASDELADALQKIADGHNDARTLARDVLARKGV